MRALACMHMTVMQHWCLAVALLMALVMPEDPLRTSVFSFDKSKPALARAAWHECNSQGIYPGLYGSEVLANLTAFKSTLLSQVHPSFNPEAKYLEGFDRYNPYKPFIECPPHRPPSPYYRWRFCDLAKAVGPCVVYSVGPVQNDYAFEKDIISQTKCEVHTFDCTKEDGKSIDPRHKFHKTCIGRDKPNHQTLGEIVTTLGHQKGIEAMQIDVEGPDAELFSELRIGGPMPHQIAAEIHLRPPPPKTTGLPTTAAHSPAQVALIFGHLANLGYGVTVRQDNLGGEPGCCAEFSWLRVERVWQHGAARAASAHTRYSSLASAGSTSGSTTAAAAAGSTAAAEPEAQPLKAKRLVVSLASFPGRAEFAAPTIYSIMHGTRKPDALYFWVTVGVARFDGKDEVNEVKEIPNEAKMLADQFKGVVKVLAPKKDYGPATKLLPTLEVETDPDTIIITVDDDTFYSPTTVAELEDEMLRRPGYAIVRSCEVTHWDDKKSPPAKGWREWKLSEGVCKGFMTAYASAAYRREYLDDLVFNQTRAPEGCLHHDDVWFSAHLWIRNVPIWVLNYAGRSWPPMYHRPKNRMSISMHPDAEKKIQQCLDWFHWLDDDNRRKEELGSRAPYQPY